MIPHSQNIEMMNENFYESPQPGRIMQLLWKAAGADQFILKKSTYGDQVKYACLGGIVLSTGVMAGIAGAYAFYTIFEPKGTLYEGAGMQPMVEASGNSMAKAGSVEEKTDILTALFSVIFGIIWGTIIFNIDRFIVSATGKGDGTEAITGQEFRNAIPRIIMGMIIAITISKPVEIRMFKSEIDAELHKKQIEKQLEYREGIEKKFVPDIEAKQKKIAMLRSDLREKTQQRNTLQQDLQSEIQGRVGSGKEGYGAAAKAIEQNKELVQQELDELEEINNEKIKELEAEIKAKKANMDEELAKSYKHAEALDGLLERIKLAHEIAGIWITLFITLLFMAIELTPIFFKMMLIKSPYDFMDDNYKDLLKAAHGIEVQYEFYKDKQGQERHLVINHQAKNLIEKQVKLLESKKEINNKVIEKWKEKELKNMEENLEAYIKSENE